MIKFLERFKIKHSYIYMLIRCILIYLVYVLFMCKLFEVNEFDITTGAMIILNTIVFSIINPMLDVVIMSLSNKKDGDSV